MKKSFRKILAILLAGLMMVSFLTVMVTASASGLTESTSRLFVDGTEVSTGERGNVPFLINGTTFLPVRAMSTAFDREAHWEPVTATLYFGDRVDPVASYDLVVTIPGGMESINLEQILELEITEFEAVDRGNVRNFAGVPLATVFETMGLDPADAHSFAFVAADGMTATASADEVLDPANGWLVLEEDGEMFASREAGGRGPFMVVFADDGVPARWVRTLMEIIVISEPGTAVMQREINIIADGNAVNTVDVAGNAASPFMLGGVIYMPIRAVSVAMGMSVEWNGAENIILIGDAPDDFDVDVDDDDDDDADDSIPLEAIDASIVIYAGGRQHVVTMGDFVEIGIEEFYATIRGERRDFAGVSMAAIMEFLNLDASTATGTVVFRAHDGHSTGGTVAEVFDPTNGFIAISEDGTLLGHWEDGGRGPFMVVFAQDVFAQRFLRYLTEIEINMSAPADG